MPELLLIKGDPWYIRNFSRDLRWSPPVPMKILHVATFIGNIGDNASHQGFHRVLDAVLPGAHSVTPLEIRKTYGVYTLADKWRFDHDFARLANAHDLVLIGGGHFLDFWVKSSVTGTTLDIAPEVLDAIHVPIAIVSMGCMHRTEVPEENVVKLRRFLDTLLARPLTFVAVRNDGSKAVLRDVVGAKYHEAIPEVLDSGFFYENDGTAYRPSERDYVVLNSTVDQLLMKSRRVGTTDIDHYRNEVAGLLRFLLEETELQLVFAPHIYSDYTAIQFLLEKVNDFHVRTRVIVTPYAQGDFGCQQVFSAYRNARLVIGMRFHANVCSVSMGKATVGLAATDRVITAYESLGLSNRYCRVDRPFAAEVIGRARTLLANPTQAMTFADTQLRAARAATVETYRGMVGRLGL